MSKLSLPEKKRNIVLVGHMGSGKTTVGKELAKRTQFKFYDIDKEIEKITKKTINKIFEQDGEAKFRKLEEKFSMQILETKESVIALGGGAFQSNIIRQKSIKDSICIWLRLDIKSLSERCELRKNRPLLLNKNIKKELDKINNIRKSNFGKSHYTIEVSGKTKYQIAKEIINIFAN